MKLFQDLDSFTQEDIEAALIRNDPQELLLVPITVALVTRELQSAEDVCMRLCSHPLARVRASAVISLGHLARRFRNLNEALVKPLVEIALRDADEEVRSSAKSAADEIHQFLHWQIAGHLYG